MSSLKSKTLCRLEGIYPGTYHILQKTRKYQTCSIKKLFARITVLLIWSKNTHLDNGCLFAHNFRVWQKECRLCYSKFEARFEVIHECSPKAISYLCSYWILLKIYISAFVNLTYKFDFTILRHGLMIWLRSEVERYMMGIVSEINILIVLCWIHTPINERLLLF